jgi:hypothetical protein
MSRGKQINWLIIYFVCVCGREGGRGNISLESVVNVWLKWIRWPGVSVGESETTTEQNNRGEGEDGFIGSISVNN